MNQSANLTVFICGGYFLTKRVTRPAYVSNLMPESLVTLSNCFTDISPDTWADAAYKYTDQERAEEAAKFGISLGVVPGLVKIFTDAIGDKHLTYAFPNLCTGREFYRHCADKEVAVLLGIGLERSLLPSVHKRQTRSIEDTPWSTFWTERLRLNAVAKPSDTSRLGSTEPSSTRGFATTHRPMLTTNSESVQTVPALSIPAPMRCVSLTT